MNTLKRLFVYFSLVGLVLSACGRAATTDQATDRTSMAPASTPTLISVAQPPDDFAFNFEYGSCLTNRADTFTNTFRKDMGDQRTRTIPLMLTPVKMETIYRQLVASDFFSYPPVYKVQLPTSGEAAAVTPASRYRWIVRSAGRTTTVAWLDEIVKPNPPEAQRLRDLATLMVNLIESRPEVKQLPQPNVGCA